MRFYLHTKKVHGYFNIEILLNFSNHQLGKIENDDEVLMMIKTRTTRIPELTEYVKTNHPYDVAEVITTSIEQGNQPYLDWLGKTVPEKSTDSKSK